MFKKSKPELTPPKPPTFTEILEDMETFLVEKPPIERVRSLPNASNSPEGSSNNVDLENWWKVFETFYSDNEDLQSIRRKIIACQKELEGSKTEIKDKTDSIQHQIDVALQDSPIDLG